MTEYHRKQVEALEKAVELCRENDCEEAVAPILFRIRWIKDCSNFIG